ncbi:hypothetical protein V511_10390 [Mesotoga sp. Brook.08.YT.4.2.5.1]|nr:hypothetical protein V511_10390 [Mesotoga sp. Brook.08.YT.4.2.5.1]RAO96696.1 hypothetical protein M388_13040 [Mesotoga sp. Brook.08.YT.4.2.5.4.]RDI93373.1 hypothetical protein Q502_06095 [Mesotoga sp. Brook.08.YT.4.2.5.2.]
MRDPAQNHCGMTVHDHRSWSVPSFALPAAALSRSDPVQVHHEMTKEALIRAGSLGNHTLSSGHPGMLQARISVFETVASDKMQVE